MYNILEFDPEGEQEVMPSAEYVNAKKEFRNCLLMSIFGLGVPIVIAFRERFGKDEMEAEFGNEGRFHSFPGKSLVKFRTNVCFLRRPVI